MIVPFDGKCVEVYLAVLFVSANNLLAFWTKVITTTLIQKPINEFSQSVIQLKNNH